MGGKYLSVEKVKPNIKSNGKVPHPYKSEKRSKNVHPSCSKTGVRIKDNVGVASKLWMNI